MKKLSFFGILLVLLYLAGTAFCWYYARSCSGQYCGYVVVIPVLPWIIFVERFIDHDLAFYAYGFIFLTNIVAAYWTGKGIGWLLRALFRIIRPKKVSPKPAAR